MPAEITWRQGNLVKVRDRRTGKTLWGYVKTLDGRKHTCTAFSKRTQAEEALSALIHQHHMQRLGVAPPSPPVTLKELIDLYLVDARDRGVSKSVVESTKRTLERFTELVSSDARLTSVTGEDLRRYRGQRLEDGRHAHTIKFELKRLRTVFLSAKRLFDLSWDPPVMPEVKSVHQGREVVLSSGQIAALLAAATGVTRDLILMGLHTAMRIGELRALERRHVDFTEGVDSSCGRLRFIGEKGKREASLPLTAQASAILRRRLAATKSERPDDLVFDISYDAARRAFIKACKTAGIPYGVEGGIVIHTLRHSAASFLADLGVPPHILKMITRHSTGAMLMRYTHASLQAVGEAISKLENIGGE